MGTAVATGRAVGVVVATGEDTRIGAIAGEVRGTERTATPLQTRMRVFGNRISVAVLAVAVGLLGVGLQQGIPLVEVFLLVVWGVIPRGTAGAFPLLLLPAQALWLNVVNNGIQDVALAFEPGETEQFHRPPHPPDEGLLSRPLLERTFLVGGTLAGLAVAVFRVEIADSALAYAQTAALTTMVVSMAQFLGTCRSETRWVLGNHPLSNPVLFVGTLAALVVHVGVLHFGPTQALLNLEPIAPETWLRILLVAPSVLVVAELHKRIRGRPVGE